MKRLLFYCQHLLGMGHFMRSSALVHGLANDFQICFLNGGEVIPSFGFPPHVEVVNLPPMKSDEAFTRVEAVNGQELATLQQSRRLQILDTFERWQPDLVVIELYPFGRKKFSFELLPLLARIRVSAPQTKVACSLRDILVSRPNQSAFEAQVCAILNRYFDLVLVHADPKFQRLEETFGAVAHIKPPIHYTGYVAQSKPSSIQDESTDDPDAIGLKPQLPLLLASIGGGRVGVELLEAAIEASKRLHAALPHQLLVFGGPYLPVDQLMRLQQLAADSPHIYVRHYTTHFLTYMARAALSISMAGYNTCINILTTGVRALTLPFAGGDNNEQSIRAAKLAALGVVSVLQPEDLAAETVQVKIREMLQADASTASLQMDGVTQTAAYLHTLGETSEARALDAAPHIRCCHPNRNLDFEVLRRELRPFLEKFGEEGRHVPFFVRDDDIDKDEESLRYLLDIGLSRSVPLNLAVIPAILTEAGIELVKRYKKLSPTLLEVHQHGWQHVNHEPAGRKHEFGASRSYEEQLADIGRGKALLEQAFGDRFFPAFTPPWNRCTAQTLAVLDDLNFKVFSKDRDGEPLHGYGFREISISVNFMAKGGESMRSPQEIVEKVVGQMQRQEQVGIMLHHKVMDGEAFAFFDQLLAELCRCPAIRFYTFEELLGLQEPQRVPVGQLL